MIWFLFGWPLIWQNPKIPPETQKVQAVATKMLLFWDGGSAPSGWSIVTTYDGKFPRGESAVNFGTTGGNSTHTPTVASITNNAQSATNVCPTGTGTANALSHAHTSLSSTVGSANNLPAFRSLKLIQFDAGIPASIPAGAIAIFDAAQPTGWTRQSTQDSQMIRVNSSIATGGSDTHQHSLTWSSLGAVSSGSGKNSNGTANLSPTAHTHTAPTGTNTTSITALPPYIEVVVAKADSNTSSLPNNMIAMFDADPGSAWTIKSDSGGPFYQKFIQGKSSYNGTSQGATTHNHASGTSGASGASVGAAVKGNTGSTCPSNTHTHTLIATFNTGTDNVPQYFNVVYAKKNTNVVPNAPSQNSPTNNATDVSTTPTFTMTAIDTDPDNISYKVTLYSNSGCTTVVQTNDQAVSATGWSGSDATCTASPTACYKSGTQGTYVIQSVLSNSTQYWWRVSAKDPDGSATFTNSSTCNTFTTAAVISVTITTDGIVAYSILPAGTSKDTTSSGLNDTQTTKNDGTVAEDFNIKTSNATSGVQWILGSSAGTNIFVHEFSTDSGGAWTKFSAADTYQTLTTNIATNGTKNVDFRITVPSTSSDYQQKNITVTIQAVQH